MSIFSRFKPQGEKQLPTGLSDEKKAQIDAVVASWGDVQRTGRASVYDGSEPPVQILAPEGVAYFVAAMESEAARIDAEATELQKRRLAEIAQKDAEIAAIKREIEATKAKIQTQNDEIDRRVRSLSALVRTAQKIIPQFDASNMQDEAAIRREVVRRRFGDVAVDGRSEAYIDERFESLEARVNVDPFAAVVKDGIKQSGGAVTDMRDAAEKAWQDMVADLHSSHQKH